MSKLNGLYPVDFYGKVYPERKYAIDMWKSEHPVLSKFIPDFIIEYFIFG